MMAKLNIEWSYIEWDLEYNWNEDIVPQLVELGITEEQLNRAVYVIRCNDDFAIDYPNKPSMTLYIGEGNFKNRIIQHKNWLKDIRDVVGEFPLEIALAIPRARNNRYVYKDVEADLLYYFKEIHGVAPFLNKQMEYAKIEHEYEDYYQLIEPLQIGRGRKIPWAIRPLPSNKHWSNYWKTCD
ncbi:hypothetical protein I8B06_004299 [Vibrio vulnificus]|nr:hypothetical protein [Vibrio vulnificus]